MDDARQNAFTDWLIDVEEYDPNDETVPTYVGNIRRVEERITANFEIAVRGEEQIMINLDTLDRNGMLRLYRWFEYTAEDARAGPPPEHIRAFRLNAIGSTDSYKNSINLYAVFRGLGELHNRQRRN